MDLIKKRVLVSLDGECPYYCKHCYTYELPKISKRSMNEIVESISNKEFDIIYVSQKIENFADPNVGLDLCEHLFQAYHSNLMIITRNVLRGEHFERLVALHREMRQTGKMLFWGSSVIGLDSARYSEQLSLIPSTLERLDFIKNAYNKGISTMLLIRPLFPSKLIPNIEIEKMIDYMDGMVSCVLTGPLMVNDYILKRLGLHDSDLTYTIGDESEYLNGVIKEMMRYVDTSQELEHLKEYCDKKGLPFFKHSMPAVNYLYNLNT